MGSDFSFDEYDIEDLKEKKGVELIKNTSTPNTNITKEKDSGKKINFQSMPQDTEETLSQKIQKELIEKYTKEEPIAIPIDNLLSNSYLSLVLSPNLRDLELMIRGLEYVKRFNPISQREEIILRKIPNHPLNEFGINQIMQELKIYSSPEIKLGRKRIRDYYLSVQQVSRSITRLIYKNLKNFGMDSQVKQRSAKTFCLAIIEIVDASFSRSIEGKENDLSRATEFKIEGNIDSLQDPSKMFNTKQKQNLKN